MTIYHLSKTRYIWLIVWVLLSGATLSSAHAKLAAKDTLSVEEEQQFLYYFYEAQRLIQKEDILPAWELTQFCYALNPNNATVNNYMGVFLDAFDQKAEAIGYFRRAFELDPNEYWYQYTLYLKLHIVRVFLKVALHFVDGLIAIFHQCIEPVALHGAHGVLTHNRI